MIEELQSPTPGEAVSGVPLPCASRPEPLSERFSSSPQRILVADDEYEIRQVLVDLLELEGFRVDTAEDGRVAREMLQRGGYDLLLTDLHMPKLDGLELIESVRRLCPDLPVIVITGYPSLRKAIEVMKSGAVDFLPKPFDSDTVIHVVRRTLKERVLMQENQRLMAEVNNKAVIENLNRELHSKVAELTRLNIIAEQLSPMMDTNRLFDLVAQMAGELTESQQVSLMLLDRRRQVLRIRSARGLAPDVIRRTEIPLGQGVAGIVAQSKLPLRGSRRMLPGAAEERLSFDHHLGDSWICVPLLIGNELFGVLGASQRLGNGVYSAEDERILLTLAEKVAAKVENNALYESLYENLLDTLHSLITSIEAKDPCTHRHSRRVTDLAVAIGLQMKLGNEEVESLRFATVLHDIGKIGIRDSILSKNGRLDQDEYEKIKQHPLIGLKIVEPLGLTRAEQAIVRHHHERVDGQGYPDGLKGDQINLLARIASVADAFDAMTSTRSDRQALSIDQALEELHRSSGTQFDGAVVDVLQAGVDSGAIRISPSEERLPVAPTELAV